MVRVVLFVGRAEADLDRQLPPRLGLLLDGPATQIQHAALIDLENNAHRVGRDDRGQVSRPGRDQVADCSTAGG